MRASKLEQISDFDHVQLDRFGSAASGSHREGASDLDLIVDRHFGESGLIGVRRKMDTDLQELFIGHWQQLPYLDCVELWEVSSIR